jgi:hypothetical protein
MINGVSAHNYYTGSFARGMQQNPQEVKLAQEDNKLIKSIKEDPIDTLHELAQKNIEDRDVQAKIAFTARQIGIYEKVMQIGIQHIHQII